MHILHKNHTLSTPTVGVDALNNRLLDKIQSPEVPGTRHHTAIGIALELHSDGLNSDQVYEVLREKYSDDKTDKELRDIVQWTESRATPNVNPNSNTTYQSVVKRSAPNAFKPKIDKQRVLSVLSLNSLIETDFLDKSPVNVDDAGQAQLLFITHLFEPGELISVVPAYGSPEVVKTREQWIQHLRNDLAPCSDKGGWFRVNPIKRGHGQFIKDSDVASYRYLLIEADDNLSLRDQLQLLGTKIRSVAAITYSGNKSYHALVRIDSSNENDYRSQTKRILTLLKPLGVDPANGNPSRMSRMPNVYRNEPEKDIAASQKLIYLNPDPKPVFIFNGKEGQS